MAAPIACTRACSPLTRIKDSSNDAAVSFRGSAAIVEDIGAQLTVSNVPLWVETHLRTGVRTVVQLSGGVSGVVLLVGTTDGGRLIVKQALPQLRVEAEWLCDPRRALRESAALRVLGPLMPPGSIPEYLCEDSEGCTFAMNAAPEGFRTWKSDLMAGECSVAVARRVGELLRSAIQGTIAKAEAAEAFGDLDTFEALRLQPYYGHLAVRYGHLRETLEALSADCRNTRVAVVHGDFSPKNLLTDGQQVMVIDWECVHFGQPGFDVAFLLNHLLLKSFHRPKKAAVLGLCAEAFWHEATLDLAPAERIQESALRHLPALLLARVDGKSPAEYITSEALRQQVRALAMDCFERPLSGVADLFERRSVLCL